MQIRYLGTAAAEGWPALFCDCPMCRSARTLGGKNVRTRSQVLINEDLLVDFPPDSLAHVHAAGLNLLNVEHLIVTHTHRDHLCPDELLFRAPPFSTRADGAIHILGNEAVGRVLAAAVERFPSREAGGYVQYDYVAPFEPCRCGNYTITPLLATHDPSEDCYIYVIERDGKRILYANDSGRPPDASMDYIVGMRFDVVSMDCTMGQNRDGNNHMGIDDTVDLAAELASAGCVDSKTTIVLTHFSHNGGLLHHEIEERVRPYGFITAYDGMSLSV